MTERHLTDVGMPMFDCPDCDSCVFSDLSAQGFHEIHVTVETNDVQKFVSACHANSIKPIVIEFQHHLDKSTMTHVMTSQRLVGNDYEALAELDRICRVMADQDLKVVRRKIEVGLQEDRDTSAGYFESHLSFKITLDQRPALEDVAKTIGGIRLSRNAFKKVGDSITLMATVRMHGVSGPEFRSAMEEIRNKFAESGFVSDKLIIEYCWLDDHLSSDDTWKPI